MGPVVGVIAQILVALSLAGIGIAQARGRGFAWKDCTGCLHAGMFTHGLKDVMQYVTCQAHPLSHMHLKGTFDA